MRYHTARLKNEGRRGGIVNLSSLAGVTPFSQYAVYSAGKSFDDFLSRAVGESVGKYCDVLSVRPGYVSTELTHYIPVGGSVITAKDCATNCLYQLGRSPYTSGHYMHAIFGQITTFFPPTIRNFFDTRESSNKPETTN
jgi:short-subunit dehydrogenase